MTTTWTAQAEAVTDADGKLIAECFGDAETRITNAARISALPELLDLARRIAEAFEDTDGPAGELARTALKKAEGEA